MLATIYARTQECGGRTEGSERAGGSAGSPEGVEARSEVVAEAQAGVEVGVGVEAVVI